MTDIAHILAIGFLVIFSAAMLRCVWSMRIASREPYWLTCGECGELKRAEEITDDDVCLTCEVTLGIAVRERLQSNAHARVKDATKSGGGA